MTIIGEMLIIAAVLVSVGATPLAWVLFGVAGLFEGVIVPTAKAAMREDATRESAGVSVTNITE